MENGTTTTRKIWNFKETEKLESAPNLTIRIVLDKLRSCLDIADTRSVIPLCLADPSAFPCFRTTPIAEDAIVDAVRSAKFNCYSPTVGILPARRAVAEYLSQDLPYKLSPDDIYLTSGCLQAIEVLLSALARPNTNILLPTPGFLFYEARAAFTHIEMRHYSLLPEKEWEVDLNAVESLADENTVAIVIINPGNPCGNVYTDQHLKKVAETARKLGILVISDEVYAHLAFGSRPFVPMGVFGSISPVITLGSISKMWIVPGWRLSWLVINDPNGILKEHGVIDSITGYLNISSDPATFIQVQLHLNLLEDIEDDLDFCAKLAREESMIILPGVAVGLKNWLRITFACEPSYLEDGFQRLNAFYKRHAKKQ